MITKLIPQRDPILMVHNAQPWGEQGTCTSLKVEQTNWFVQGDILLEAGIVEHMAQSAAAMVGLASNGQEPKVGYIGDVKDFRIERLPKVGEIVTSYISIVTQMENIILIQAISNVGDEQVAQAKIKIFIVD